MTRTKEELALRKEVKAMVQGKGLELSKVDGLITALVRAVQENCAKMAERYKGHYVSNDPFVGGVVESLCDDISIAIRRKR